MSFIRLRKFPYIPGFLSIFVMIDIEFCQMLLVYVDVISICLITHWFLKAGRKWQPTPVFLLGKAHGWRSLVDYSPWGRKELDTTEWLNWMFCYFNLYQHFYTAFLVAQTVKHLPAMRETWVRSLGWEGPLEKEMATYCSTLAWKIPWMEEPGRLQPTGSKSVGHNWVTSISIFNFIYTLIIEQSSFLLSVLLKLRCGMSLCLHFWIFLCGRLLKEK